MKPYPRQISTPPTELYMRININALHMYVHYTSCALNFCVSHTWKKNGALDPTDDPEMMELWSAQLSSLQALISGLVAPMIMKGR